MSSEFKTSSKSTLSQLSDSDSLSTNEDYANESFEEDASQTSSFERLAQPQKPKVWANKTFTAAQVREIERQNTILMNKILAHSKPTRPKAALSSSYQMSSSAAINRKKDQMKIDWENQILLRKIQKVKPCIKRQK